MVIRFSLNNALHPFSCYQGKGSDILCYVNGASGSERLRQPGRKILRAYAGTETIPAHPGFRGALTPRKYAAASKPPVSDLTRSGRKWFSKNYAFP